MSNIAYELFASRLKESMNQQQMKPIDLLHLAEEQNLKLGKGRCRLAGRTHRFCTGFQFRKIELWQYKASD